MIIHYPKNCILLEWSEQQQQFHFNYVNQGVAESIPNTNGYLTVHVSLEYKEAKSIVSYIEKYIKKRTPSKGGNQLTAREMTEQIKAILEFPNNY